MLPVQSCRGPYFAPIHYIVNPHIIAHHYNIASGTFSTLDGRPSINFCSSLPHCRGLSLAPVYVYVCLCVCIHGDVVSREDLFVIQYYFCMLVAAGSSCLNGLDFIHFSFDYILHSLRLFA